MASRDIIKRLKREGWSKVRSRGSHQVFQHPEHETIVVVPHPQRNIPTGTLRSIFRQAGWDWKTRK